MEAQMYQFTIFIYTDHLTSCTVPEMSTSTFRLHYRIVSDMQRDILSFNP